MASRKLEVVITGDARGLERAFGRAGKESRTFGSRLASFGKVAAAGLSAGSVAAGAFGIKAIQLAGNAEEVGSKLNVVFGKQTPKLIKNLDAFSEATGASRFELRQQAADMGALLKPLVGTTQGTQKMSTQVVKLATDLGSFNNVPTAEALEAIRSGLVGEAEPLRKFSVLINDAAVKNKAYEMGLADTGAELTEQQKVQARYALIMGQTRLAQGDAIRTQGSFTNQLKRFRNTLTDTATLIGVKFLPIATRMLEWANKLGPRLASVWDRAQGGVNRLVTRVSILVDAFRAARDSGLGVAASLGTAIGSVLGDIDFAGVAEKMGKAMAVAFNATASVSASIAEGIRAAVAQVDGRDVLEGLVKIIAEAINTLFSPSFWQENFANIFAVVTIAIPIAKILKIPGAGALYDLLSKPFFTAFAKLGGALVGLGRNVTGQAVESIVGAITAAAPRFAVSVGLLISFGAREITKRIAGFGTEGRKLAVAAVVGVAVGLRALADEVADAFRVAINTITRMVPTALAAGKQLGSKTVDGVTAGLSGLSGLAQDLSGRVLRAVASVAASAYSMATGIGRAIVSGVAAGLGGLASAVTDRVVGGLRGAVSAAGGLLRGSGPFQFTIHEIAEPMMEGVAKGIMEKGSKVKAALTQTIRDAIRDAKGNLSSLAGGLASSIGAGIDARAAGRLAAVDNSPEAKRIKEIEDSLRAEDLARERFRLEQAIATTNDANEQREAQQALNAFLLNQEAETLRATLEQRRVTIQQEETDRKAALERGLADLADAFNRGEIRAAKFHKRVQGMLRAAGVDYADLGRMLGSSFANAFREQLQAVHDQVREIAGAPQANRITGAEPGVTQVQRRARATPARSGSAKTVNITVNASGKAADDPSAIAGRIGRELAVAGI